MSHPDVPLSRAAKIWRCLVAALVVLLWVLSRPAAFAADNPGVVEIPDPAAYTQIVAISDVHGENIRVRKLLSEAGILDTAGKWAAGKTLLVVVGDSIDKGPQSLEVLELWQDLMPQAAHAGGRVVVLLGNHEAEYLAKPANDKKAAELYAELHGRQLPNAAVADTATAIDGRKLGEFMHSLPLAVRVGDWLFCHAGWIASPDDLSPKPAGNDPKAEWAGFVTESRSLLQGGMYSDKFLIGSDSILETKAAPGETKKWWKSRSAIAELERRLGAYGLRGVVLGHQPAAFGLDDQVGAFAATKGENRFFKTDSGMAPVAAGDDGEGGSQKARDGYPGHILIFTRPAEFSGMAGIDPAHVFSAGYDVQPDGGRIFARHTVPISAGR